MHTRAVCFCMVALAMVAKSAVGVTVTFQEGIAGYVGTSDTFVQQAAPTANNGALERSEWDSDDPSGTGQDNVALLRFDNIIGSGPGQIPIGSQITSATLAYTVFDSGNAGDLHEAAVNWNESTSWNTLGASPGVQPSDYGDFVALMGGSIGTLSVPVTASLAKWTADPASNRGWFVLPTGAGGVEFRSSEYLATPTLRPRLTVIYNAGPAEPSLVRRPYLQKGTPTSMTFCWRTDFATDTALYCGVSPDQLIKVAENSSLVVDHVVTLNGLQPSTTIYYAVGTTSQMLAGGDAEHRFTTSPVFGSKTQFGVWVVGDSGTGDANQTSVRDAMLAETAGDPPELYIHVGDMAYEAGTDIEFTNNFFAPYRDILRNTICWPTLGNHEGYSANSATQTGPYYQAYVLPIAAEAGGLASGTEAYYSFDYANVHFICLDSHDTPRTPGSPMLVWLAADLAATDQDWIIAFWHHPPYSKGTHDSDDQFDSEGRLVEMREYVLPVMEAGGVDLVLAGHSHVYERSFLVDGAYDTPTTSAGHIVDGGDGRISGSGAYRKMTGLGGHGGAVYVVAGHGGRDLGGAGGHPLMYFTEFDFGSCLLTINGNTLAMKNIRHDGVISDQFDLIKTPPGDIDIDGDVDSVDLALFVKVLLAMEVDPGRIDRSDLDGNGVADGADTQLFVEALLNP